MEALSLEPMRKSGSVRMIQAYIRIKMLIGLRRGDLLRLRMADITDTGIKVTPRKTAGTTGITRTFEWSPELRAAVDMAKAARPLHIAPWLFCTGKGEGYFDEETGRPHGWNSMWQRFMARLLKDSEDQGAVYRARPTRQVRERCGEPWARPAAPRTRRQQDHRAGISTQAGDRPAITVKKKVRGVNPLPCLCLAKWRQFLR